jgi:hypothetical protein
MVFWVNAHGAFILGGVLIGISMAGELLRQIFSKPEQRDWQKAKWLMGILILTFFSVMVNPKGPGIIGYVINLMTDQPSQKLIMEWQSPTPQGFANTAFFISILLFIIAFWFIKRDPKIEDLFLFTGFLWLAWSGVRYIVWFSITTMPILAESIVMLLRDKSRSLKQAGRRNILNIAISLLVIIPVILVQPWFVERVNLPLPDKYWALIQTGISEGPFVSVKTPVAAVDYLLANPDSKIFNDMGYGSYFIWALPDIGIFVDPRVELYPYEQWQDYSRIMHGVRYNALLDKYGANRIILDVEIQENLADSLSFDPQWRLVFDDNQTQIWDKLMSDSQ